jgi:hypothetical protein
MVILSFCQTKHDDNFRRELFGAMGIHIPVLYTSGAKELRSECLNHKYDFYILLP